MGNKCQEQLDLAHKTMEHEEEKRKSHSQENSYTMDKTVFFLGHYTSVESALIVEEGESCIANCKRPAEIFKRIIQQNFGEVQQNIQGCTGGCETPREDGKGKEVNFECVIGCLEGNMEIMKELDKRLSDNFIQHQDRLFF